MNTIKRFANVFLLSIITVTSLFPVTAQAGFLTWITQSDTASVSSGEQISFDELLNSIKGPDINKETLQLVQDSYIVAPNINIAPKSGLKSAKRTYMVSASAYSSTPDQTDSSPFITAKGTYVRDGVVASNFLPFGTRIKFPTIYGDKVFIVEDRMNKRYWQNVDIWFADRETAKKFGRRQVVIEIVS